MCWFLGDLRLQALVEEAGVLPGKPPTSHKFGSVEPKVLEHMIASKTLVAIERQIPKGLARGLNPWSADTTTCCSTYMV